MSPAPQEPLSAADSSPDEPSGDHAHSSSDPSIAIEGLDSRVPVAADAAVPDLGCDTAAAALSDTSCPPGATTAGPANPVQFRSYTIAPSPPILAPGQQPEFPSPAPAPILADDPSHLTGSPEHLPQSPEPSLHLQTDLQPSSYYATPARLGRRSGRSLRSQASAQSLRPVSRTPSLRAGAYGAFGSASAASSTVPSPVISAMGDLTPLPSPLMANGSPGPWKQLLLRTSQDSTTASGPIDSNDAEISPTRKERKPYDGLQRCPPPADQTGRLAQPQTQHTRNRSISEYIPDPMLIPKRMSTVTGVRAKPDPQPALHGQHLRREPHLSEARGITPIEKPPTPPPSESSLSTTDLSLTAAPAPRRASKSSHAVYFEAYGRHDGKRRRWRALRVLGQGTFSQVYLATSQSGSPSCEDEDYRPSSDEAAHDRRSFVAVKICEHGPRGGASEERIEMSLKRELEIMRSVRHPSVVNLKAWSIEQTRAILVLSYYPGGDLFDVATRHRSLLTPCLIRRMFSELVGAVMYLHSQNIVHRDIKLENVLVNLPPSELSPDIDWTTYPYSVTTLTDLGLSRRVAPDEKLETRCGSDDYAAPEVIMGQPYDGRATDAWSLGVLLYALLESRLPFDPPPCGPQGFDHAMQMRMRSRTSHRIARVEWRWYEFGAGEGEDGEGDHEADPNKFRAKGLLGAMEAVEALLKRARSRWPLAKVAELEWVAKGVAVDGGIRFREEEDGEEV
ncbi:hypothetical protein VTJ04DRAFT_7778 [Mycothermus thermophilus]|uniref:uncharacterized protein n=1 Tax=Humicola insolens TaxID=85995 RepID=UPI0037428C21